MKINFNLFLLNLFFVFVVNSSQPVCLNDVKWLRNFCPADDLFEIEQNSASILQIGGNNLSKESFLNASSAESGNFSSTLINVNLTSSGDDATTTTNVSQKIGDDLRTGDDEPQIASFDEWTKQKLEEHQTKVADNHKNGVVSSGGNVVPQMAARNYASKECGAKVLHSNPEAQNAAAVLNEKERDEYMLNPCHTEGQKWFVVELCETIQITKIEIANFELFSSRPKDFKVWSSERYPSPEWTLLGDWVAEDKRELQGYDVNNRFYAKYLKVDLISHYGSEHFCPLSLLRVLGVSMVEEYENEAMTQDQHTKGMPTQNLQQNETIAPSTNSTNADAISTPAESTKSDYLESAKKAVVSIAKEMYGKAHSVFMGAYHLHHMPSSSGENKTVCSASNNSFYPSPVKISWTDCNTCRINLSASTVDEKFCGYFLLLTSPVSSTSQIISLSNADETASDEKSAEFDDYDAELIPPPTGFHFDNEPIVVVGVMDEENETVENSTHLDDESSSASAYTESHYDIEQTKNETQTTEIVDQNKTQSTNGGQTSPTPPSSTLASLPGVATSTKESVFLRLNNRIKTLELNISLSSQYLSELSKKYRKQMEDIQRAFNRTSRLFNETDAKFEVSLEKQATDLSTLKEELSAMRPLMATLAKDYVVLQKEGVQWIVGFVFVEVLAVILFLYCCFGHRRRSKEDLASIVDRKEIEILIERAVAKRLETLLQQNNFNYKTDEYFSKQDSCETGSSNADLMSVNDVQNGNIVKKKKCKKKTQHKLVSGQILISPTIRKSSDQTFRPTSISGVESTTSTSASSTTPADRSSNSAGILFSTSVNENRNWTKVHQKPHKIERKKSNTSTKSDPDQDKFKSSTSCITSFIHSTNPFDVLTSASDRKRCSVDASRGFS